MDQHTAPFFKATTWSLHTARLSQGSENCGSSLASLVTLLFQHKKGEKAKKAVRHLQGEIAPATSKAKVTHEAFCPWPLAVSRVTATRSRLEGKKSPAIRLDY